MFVREAIEAGGVPLVRHEFAKDYGPSLLAVEFHALFTSAGGQMTEASVMDADTLAFQPGDVVVIQPIKGHPAGHMAMWEGDRWISDFTQRRLYPSMDYGLAKPPYTVYRFTGEVL